MNFEIDSFFEEKRGDVWRAGAQVDRKSAWFESGDAWGGETNPPIETRTVE